MFAVKIAIFKRLTWQLEIERDEAELQWWKEFDAKHGLDV